MYWSTWKTQKSNIMNYSSSPAMQHWSSQDDGEVLEELSFCKWGLWDEMNSPYPDGVTVPAAGGDSSPVTLTKTHHPSSPLLPPGIMRSGSQMLPKQTRFSASWNEISFHQLSSGLQSTLQHSLKGIPSSSSSLPAHSTGNISYQISDQETKSWLMLSGTGNKHEPG